MEICTRFQRTKAYAHQYHLTKLSWKFRRIQAILSGCSFIFNTCLNLQTMKMMEISGQFHRTIAYAHQEHERNLLPKLFFELSRIPTILSGCSFIFYTLSLQTMKTMEMFLKFHQRIACANQKHLSKLFFELQTALACRQWRRWRFPSHSYGFITDQVLLTFRRFRNVAIPQARPFEQYRFSATWKCWVPTLESAQFSKRKRKEREAKHVVELADDVDDGDFWTIPPDNSLCTSGPQEEAFLKIWPNSDHSKRCNSRFGRRRRRRSS